MKKYLLMLCCAVVCAGFVGCSDDEEGDVSVKSLVGRWSAYQEWDGEASYMDTEFGEGVDHYIGEFNADGTGGWFESPYLSELDNENCWDRFTYTLEGSKLILRQGSDYVEECRVTKLTSSELVLAWDYRGDSGKNCTDKLYFRRMK